MNSKEKLWNANYIKVMTTNFLLYFAFYLLTPLLPLYLSETFGATKDTIGIVLSGYTVAALIVRPFCGYVVDSFSRKKVLMLCLSGFAVFFAGYIAAGTILMFAICRTLHGGPFGAVTVANSTCAIDVLPSSRRNEGIGLYGLSNNFAMAIAPSIGIYLHNMVDSYMILFWIAFVVAICAVLIAWTIRLPEKDIIRNKEKLSLDRFFLVEGWSEGLVMVTIGLSYGVLATYLAIYGKERLGMSAGSGAWFAVLSCGLILSRLVGARSLRKGRVVENVNHGILVSVFGYLLFALLEHPVGFYGAAIIIGLGNGHIWPGLQTMFINLAPHNKRGTANSTVLTCWDIGMGLGVVFGGMAIHQWSYSAAFWFAFIVNLLGVIFYFAYVRQHYLRMKLE